MRVLITGSRGQVGQSLRNNIPDTWEVIATDSVTMDITNTDKVEQMISGFQPDIIINTAAFTNVDVAEEEINKAFLINATGVLNLARSAQKNGAKLIHLSTDYVFDGKKEHAYIESDVPNPINIYGKSKLAGELLALANNPHTLIIRTSAVYSEHGHNFVKQIIKAAQTQNSIEVVSNLTVCPTYAGDLAKAIIEVIKTPNIQNGILHYAGKNSISWYEFAKLIKQLYDLNTEIIPIEEQKKHIRPCNSAIISMFKHNNLPTFELKTRLEQLRSKLQ